MNCFRGLSTWDWKGCWKTLSFWLTVAAVILPFGFVLLALLWQPARVRVRVRTRQSA